MLALGFSAEIVAASDWSVGVSGGAVTPYTRSQGEDRYGESKSQFDATWHFDAAVALRLTDVVHLRAGARYVRFHEGSGFGLAAGVPPLDRSAVTHVQSEVTARFIPLTLTTRVHLRPSAPAKVWLEAGPVLHFARFEHRETLFDADGSTARATRGDNQVLPGATAAFGFDVPIGGRVALQSSIGYLLSKEPTRLSPIEHDGFEAIGAGVPNKGLGVGLASIGFSLGL